MMELTWVGFLMYWGLAMALVWLINVSQRQASKWERRASFFRERLQVARKEINELRAMPWKLAEAQQQMYEDQIKSSQKGEQYHKEKVYKLQADIVNLRDNHWAEIEKLQGEYDAFNLKYTSMVSRLSVMVRYFWRKRTNSNKESQAWEFQALRYNERLLQMRKENKDLFDLATARNKDLTQFSVDAHYMRSFILQKDLHREYNSFVRIDKGFTKAKFIKPDLFSLPEFDEKQVEAGIKEVTDADRAYTPDHLISKLVEETESMVRRYQGEGADDSGG